MTQIVNILFDGICTVVVCYCIYLIGALEGGHSYAIKSIGQMFWS